MQPVPGLARSSGFFLIRTGDSGLLLVMAIMVPLVKESHRVKISRAVFGHIAGLIMAIRVRLSGLFEKI